MASRPPPPRPPPTPEEEVLRSMEVVEEEIDTRIETMERENSKYLAVLNYLRYINGKKSMEEKEALPFNQEIVCGGSQENIMERAYNMSKYLTEILISLKTLI